MHGRLGGAVGDWQQIVAFLALLSMFVGAIAAIGADDIKAADGLFLDLAHGLCPEWPCRGHPSRRRGPMLIYMAIYVTMNIGTFAFILTMEKDGAPRLRDHQRAVVLRHPRGRQGHGGF